MATYTTNLSLKKPATSDKIRIADINGNFDTLDSTIGSVGSSSIGQNIKNLGGAIAIISNNNTHAAVAAGQYVYVHNHGTLNDGLYTADSAIAQNGTLSASNLTSVTGGGLNALTDSFGNIKQYQFTCLKNGGKLRFSSSNTTSSAWLIFAFRGTGTNYMGAWFSVCGTTAAVAQPLMTPGGYVSIAYDSTSSKLTLTNSSTSEDVYVPVIRIWGTGTMTATQA